MSLVLKIRVHEIAFGFGGPSEKKWQSSLISYCKIPNLCQSLAKFHQNLPVMSDRTDKIHELSEMEAFFLI